MPLIYNYYIYLKKNYKYKTEYIIELTAIGILIIVKKQIILYNYIIIPIGYFRIRNWLLWHVKSDTIYVEGTNAINREKVTGLQ